MGRVILGTGEIAQHPYRTKIDGILIRTVEELCYYIYYNIETAAEELFSDELITFLSEELKMTERAEYLKRLRENHAGIKDMAVCLFCSTDYYREEEIKTLLSEIDLLYQMKPLQRKKRYADRCMKRKKYSEALKEYRNILNAIDIADLTEVEYGDILHNIAVMDAWAGSYFLAAEGFREAYERNRKKESLKQYLFALSMSGQKEQYERELEALLNDRTFYEQIEREFRMARELGQSTPILEEIRQMRDARSKGKVGDYYKMMETILSSLKEKYRKEQI